MNFFYLLIFGSFALLWLLRRLEWFLNYYESILAVTAYEHVRWRFLRLTFFFLLVPVAAMLDFGSAVIQLCQKPIPVGTLLALLTALVLADVREPPPPPTPDESDDAKHEVQQSTYTTLGGHEAALDPRE